MDEIIQILNEILSSTDEDSTQYQVLRAIKKIKEIKQGEIDLYRNLEIYNLFERSRDDVIRWLNLNEELFDEKIAERSFTEVEIRYVILSMLNRYGK